MLPDELFVSGWLLNHAVDDLCVEALETGSSVWRRGVPEVLRGALDLGLQVWVVQQEPGDAVPPRVDGVRCLVQGRSVLLAHQNCDELLPLIPGMYLEPSREAGLVQLGVVESV